MTAGALTNGTVVRACGDWGLRRVVARCLLALLTVVGAFMVAAPASAAFLEPERAFRFSAKVVDAAADGRPDARTIEVRYAIADGYYLYRERFAFAVDPATGGGAALGTPIYPKGEIKFDETFNKDVEHYRRDVVVRIPVTGASGPFTLLSTSQGCADAGLCYPPQVAKATLTTSAATSSGVASGAALGAAPRTSIEVPGVAFDDASRIERTLRGGSLVTIALLFAGLGVLLAFTPCMLPMVPILSSIIVGQSRGTGGVSRGAGFALAVAYSLGMALVYTLFGIVAGLAGEGLAAVLQTPWVLGVFAALLVLLSLSMFGFYELQVPGGVQARLADWSGRAGGGAGSTSARFAGVFAMGAVSALIVGPCVAAPLGGALLYISQTRDVVVGGVALFALAVGMSMPLLLVGLSAGSLLPRVGGWMNTVKHFFGVVLIALALYLVTPVLPAWLVMLAWSTIAILSAVHLRVFDALAPTAGRAARFAKGFGVLLLLAGAVEFIGVATGGRDVLQPLGHLAAPSAGPVAASSDRGPAFERVKTIADVDRRIASAGKPVLLDFYADWCVSCKEMERFTYADARVASRMRDFVLLKADVTANDASDRALLKRFQLFGPPGIVFFDRDGRHLPEAAVIGFQSADRFLASLARVGG